MARRGRDISKITARNQRLAARVYFYDNLCGLRLDVFLPYLSEEFDLSESRIEDLLPYCYSLVAKMSQNGISANDLRQQYPFMSWKYEHSKRLQSALLPPLILA